MYDMRTVLQRVSRAHVDVDGEIVGNVEGGVVALVAVEKGDSEDDARATARKIASLRIFPDRTPLDLSLQDVGGAVLLVSQFTLAGRVNKGRRPSFDRSEEPVRAEQLYRRVGWFLREEGLEVQTGRFGAHMMVELVNDGPVTILIFTKDGVVLP